MRRLLLAAVLLGACKKAPPPLASGALLGVVQSAKSLPPCSSVVPGEWSSGFPVPVGERRFKVLFYPVTGTPGRAPQVWSPGAVAEIDAGAGSLSSCALTGKPSKLSTQRWPEATDAWDMKTFRAREAALFDATQNVGALYAARRALKPDESAAAKEYWKAFDELAEPDLRRDYYRLNPDFWEWLRESAGGSIAKPS
jgi:hypothetical protein